MTESTVEQLEFRSELQQILHIITHSLYSHQEIFLRELISNASDAIDKIRFNSLSNEGLLEGNKDWKIQLRADKEARTLTILDNGIGMNRDSIVENLGTIAKSGTKAFLENLKQAEAASKPELIGQFGVGFYAAFMVADQVTVYSRMAGDSPDQGVRWVSDGQGSYTVEPYYKSERGTEVVLHLKEEAKEFLESWRLRSIVKQFSDFIEHPVVMEVEKEGKKEEETLNSQKALWLRSKSDITEDEYKAFYRQISGDWEDPAKIIHYSGEGAIEFKALLFLPKRKGMDLMFGEPKVGPKLYINRVMISDHCEALMPAYLRFVKGVVDCPDLPLNISREMLQHNPLLEKIEKALVKHILKALKEMKDEDYDNYKTMYLELGSILKEGLSRDWANKEAIAELLLFESLKTDKEAFTTLPKYVEAMSTEQDAIYYLAGEARLGLEHSPSLEIFKEKGWDVLFFTDPIDEFVLPSLHEYKDKKLLAADRHQPQPGEAEAQKAKEAETRFEPLMKRFKDLFSKLQDVRISTRLKQSPACLVSEEHGMGAHMERLMQKLGRSEETGESKRILELNPEHPVVQGLLKAQQDNPADPRIERSAKMLYDQALLLEGSRLEDPSAFLAQVNELLAKDLK